MREAQTPEDFHLIEFQKAIVGHPEEEKMIASFLVQKEYFLFLVAKVWSGAFKGDYHEAVQIVNEFINKTISEHLSRFSLGKEHICFYFSLKLENLASDIAHASQDDLPYDWKDRESLIQAIYAGVRKLQQLAIEA